jgi:hypothetical protein
MQTTLRSIKYSLVALYLLSALILLVPLLLARFVLFFAMKLIDTLLLLVKKVTLYLLPNEEPLHSGTGRSF